MKKKISAEEELSENQIDLFEKVLSQLESVHAEVAALSRKLQNDAVNSFKLKLINSLLTDANRLLGENYRPFTDFYTFSEDTVPTNSDVSMIVSQYLSCMEKRRADSISLEYGDWCWRGTRRKTYAPLKLVRD